MITTSRIRNPATHNTKATANVIMVLLIVMPSQHRPGRSAGYSSHQKKTAIAIATEANSAGPAQVNRPFSRLPSLAMSIHWRSDPRGPVRIDNARRFIQAFGP